MRNEHGKRSNPATIRANSEKNPPQWLSLSDCIDLSYPDAVILVEAPCTIPVVARGVRQQAVDAFDERRRRSIVGDRFERSRKPAAGIFPVSRPIGGEPFGIRGPKQYLRGRQS